jgi:natural resistance-associated macrophage protein
MSCCTSYLANDLLTLSASCCAAGFIAQVSVFINMFVTCVFAAGFYGKALQDIGLENAGQFLGEAYGPAMVYVWALGLLAAGQSSTMTGAYTGQFVMTGYLQLKVRIM